MNISPGGEIRFVGRRASELFFFFANPRERDLSGGKCGYYPLGRGSEGEKNRFGREKEPGATSGGEKAILAFRSGRWRKFVFFYSTGLYPAPLQSQAPRFSWGETRRGAAGRPGKKGFFWLSAQKPKTGRLFFWKRGQPKRKRAWTGGWFGPRWVDLYFSTDRGFL